MEVPVQNDGTTVNARTALGVVLIDPATGAAMTGSGGGGGNSNTLPPNAAQEANGNLAAILTQLQAGLKVSVTGIARTATLTRTSATGSTPVGCTQVSFANKGTASAAVGGDRLDPGDTWTIDARGNDTLNAIAYDATGTTLLIATVK
jgi:hypothetical protein